MKKPPTSAVGASSRLRRVEGRHNPHVRELRQAFSRGELTPDGDCAVEGIRIIEDAIRSGSRLSAIFFRESSLEKATRLLPQIGAQVETLLLPDRLFDSSVASETPQGVAALVRVKPFQISHLRERLPVGPIVVLAGIQDPGNVGTILRSAEAFGSAGAIFGEGTVSPFNSKAVRASAGSLFRLPLVHGNGRTGAVKLGELAHQLRSDGVRLVATSSHKGTPLEQADLAGHCALFFGNEGGGLPRDLIAEMDEIVSIPHAAQVESLNAGVAASIVLYRASTGRQPPSPAI